MAKTRTFTPRDRQGLPMDPVKGAVHDLFGVPVVAHKAGSEWSISEPNSGRLVGYSAGGPQVALTLVKARVEMLGGACALGSNMADIVPRLSHRQVHDPVFLYGAGGPIDAPELICTGATRFSKYQHRHFCNPVLAHTYQVEVPR